MSELDKAGKVLREFWKPDGSNPNKENAEKLTAWMAGNGLLTKAGNITAFLNTAAFSELRKAAAKALKLSKSNKEQTYVYADIPTKADAEQFASDFESEGCKASVKQQQNGKWTVTAVCPVK